MAQIENARAAIAQGDYPQAYQELTALLRNNQDVPDAYFLLSRIAYDHKNHEKEIEMLVCALNIDPGNPRLTAYLARAYILFGDSANALNMLESLQQHTQYDAEMCNLIALTYNRLNMYKEASNYFSKEISLGGRDPNTWFNLASTLKFCGDFSGARDAYENAIALKPDFYKAHAALTALGGISKAHNHIARLTALLNTADNPDDSLVIAHSLAKEWEALNNYDAAFQILNSAKKRKAHQLGITNDFCGSLVPRIIQSWNQMSDKGTEPDSSSATSHLLKSGSLVENSNPIFIVGMPRSGTTLVERIVSGHSRVATGGELFHFSLVLKRQLQINSQEFVPEGFPDLIDNINWGQLGRDYLNATRYLYNGKDFLIDKLPLNIMYAGAIIKAIPTAKIICLDRNPLDTITSNYRQLFSFQDSTFYYSLSLEQTATFYCQFKKLADYWQHKYPANFKLINYEALVNNPDVEIANILKFFDLDWEESCRNIEQNASPVATASAVQVRQPISSKSIGQWRHYDAYLNEVRRILRGNL